MPHKHEHEDTPCYVLYSSLLATYYKDMGKDHRRKMTNYFAAIKCATRTVLLFMDSYPSNADKHTLERVIKLAEERIRNDFGFTKAEVITACKIQKHPMTKNVTRSFPSNLPEYIANYFI